MATMYRACLIKCGSTVWLRTEDGNLRDMGGLRGDDLARESVLRRIPILSSISDVTAFDGRIMHRATYDAVRGKRRLG